MSTRNKAIILAFAKHVAAAALAKPRAAKNAMLSDLKLEYFDAAIHLTTSNACEPRSKRVPAAT